MREYFHIFASNEIYIYNLSETGMKQVERDPKETKYILMGGREARWQDVGKKERKKERKWERGRKQVETRQRLKWLLRHSRVINFVPRREEERVSPLSRPLFSFPFPR